MKILLVNPPTERQLFGTGGLFLPIGLGYIASVLRDEGHQVSVEDLTIYPMTFEQFGDRVRSLAPDVVGFTAVTPTVKMAFGYAGKAKEAGCPLTVIGGPHVTALPEESLAPGVDVVVRGEGEVTMKELVHLGRPDESIKGISYRDGENVIHTPDREFLTDLDALPYPSRDLFPDMKLYKGQPVLGNRTPIGNISTSRGCPYGCRFCFKALFGTRFRTRSAESIVDEWEYLIRHFGVKEITISDDAFTTDATRVHDVCDLLIKRKLTVPWTCSNGIRVDTATVELMRHMRAAGCYRVAFGVENGDQEVLRTIGKKITLEQVVQAIKNARRAGIKTTGFFMLGGPWDTLETMEKTVRFAIRANPDYAQFSIATPYPGSELYSLARTEGRLLIDDWASYDIYEPQVFFEMPGKFTSNDVLRIHAAAYRRFYFNPRTVARKMTTFDTYRYLPRTLMGLKKFVFPNLPFSSD